MKKNKLLEIFNVKDYEELDEFIKNNPEDSRVKDLKEVLEIFDIKDKCNENNQE